ncbi:hypothetical protein ES288_A10G035500v1 [Gossypium darwinii]|uniref:Uncharacterized protein n=2 Tax=Gossypium TaxID=3633 RepID=A0A5D2NLB8_GOSTO|nr:hypothetical protein ES288_A10G035500v1 [Gossypium darwinii]TYI04682.1 hypothetical protein ES332_A10G036300v1 [Gossypium tomentosum]
MLIFRCLVCVTLVFLLSAGSESRTLTGNRSRNQPILALRQYLNEEAKKNQFEQVKRTSPGGPDQHHHLIYN